MYSNFNIKKIDLDLSKFEVCIKGRELNSLKYIYIFINEFDLDLYFLFENEMQLIKRKISEINNVILTSSNSLFNSSKVVIEFNDKKNASFNIKNKKDAIAVCNFLVDKKIDNNKISQSVKLHDNFRHFKVKKIILLFLITLTMLILSSGFILLMIILV